jgi:prevent-host-death family protein
MSSRYVGIEDARKNLGPLVTAVQQGADVVLTRNGRPAARIVRYQEAVAMLATVATAGTITDKHFISVDETRDGSVVATPFSRELTQDEIEYPEWGGILADAGWIVITGWDDHDGYWTAEVRRGLDIADLTRFLGLPDHEQEAVFAWTGETGRDKRWTEQEAAELAEIWKADKSGSSD